MVVLDNGIVEYLKKQYEGGKVEDSLVEMIKKEVKTEGDTVVLLDAVN